MTSDPLDVVVLLGSTREGRFGPVVARWFMQQARRRDDMRGELLDLVEVDLPSVYPAERSDKVNAFVRRIGRADAFVVVSPEYNHGYPAALKQAIDLPYNEWRAKPVGFVSYGGMAGGIRAVEQLRQVFAELHVATMRDSVSFHMVGGRFDSDGNPYDPEGCNRAAATMLDQLAWWGNALALPVGPTLHARPTSTWSRELPETEIAPAVYARRWRTLPVLCLSLAFVMVANGSLNVDVAADLPVAG